MSDSQRHRSPTAIFNISAQQELLSPTNLTDSTFPCTSKKRKRAEIGDGLRFGEPFLVQAHPSLPSSCSQTLIPSLLLPRSCLPLAYLDPIGEVQDQPSPKLFTANIGALEEDVQEDHMSQPMVMIAHSTVNNKLWAVERVKCGIYALCKLSNWVTVNTLERLQVKPWVARPMRRSQMQAQRADAEWWHSTAMHLERGEEGYRTKFKDAKKTGGLALCLQRPIQKTPAESQAARQTLPLAVPGTKATLETMADEVCQIPQVILDMIRKQYQEALYASKTSLAYFAKGPLSRARANFHSHDASSYDQSTLIQFLRSNILSLTTMDTKYRETLPDMIKDLPSATISDDEGASMIAGIARKARKSKKIRIGKNGLYAGEEVDVARWWISRDQSSIACDTTDTRENATNAALLEQRARETQLQIILILETLALEASAPDPCAGCISQESMPKGGEDSQKKPKKPKKLQDLDTLLDLLADRLCIWQSMSVDEPKTSSADNRPPSEYAVQILAGAAQNDHLRQFCVDVVLPFYGARLPKLATLLCNKLGGPKQPSPKRPTLLKAATSIVSQPSDASMGREKARKPRRTLERVLTDERSGSQRRPPSLSRSVTEPVLPQLKREDSATPLSNIPLNRVAMHKRYSQREVDLHAASRATEAKLKRKAKVEQELQNAITALKKPNPRMAVKELVEDAERRVAGSYLRKSKNPVRNPFAQGVQVMATPSKNRHNDVFANAASLPRSFVTAASVPEVEGIPPSSISKISDSARKGWVPPTSAKNAARQGDRLSSTLVEQTPTRGPPKVLGRPPASLTVDDGLVAPCPDSRNSQLSKITTELPSSHFSAPWSLDVQSTPSKPRSTHHTGNHTNANNQETSEQTKPLTTNTLQTLPGATVPTHDEQEQSVYATLGWDDDVDDLA